MRQSSFTASSGTPESSAIRARAKLMTAAIVSGPDPGTSSLPLIVSRFGLLVHSSIQKAGGDRCMLGRESGPHTRRQAAAILVESGPHSIAVRVALSDAGSRCIGFVEPESDFVGIELVNLDTLGILLVVYRGDNDDIDIAQRLPFLPVLHRRERELPVLRRPDGDALNPAPSSISQTFESPRPGNCFSPTFVFASALIAASTNVRRRSVADSLMNWFSMLSCPFCFRRYY